MSALRRADIQTKSLNFREIMSLIGANLQAVKSRIAAAARACGRAPDDIRLVAVSKTFGADAVAAAHACGQHVFGENYVQEAVDKIAALASLGLESRSAPANREFVTNASDARGPSAGVASPEGPLLRPLEWHFIGPIQSNKTRLIAENFAWVHSVDRLKIAQRLSAARPGSLPPLQVCIEINIGGEHAKSGVAPAEALQLARAVSALPGLTLRGLMAIPPETGDPAGQRSNFARLRELKEQLMAAGIALDTLSMGMSADLEAAIAEGATLVRVGTAIFGRR
jgi:uncharacterized pyridoxal phosphate-containing UPF0001 family protein